MKKVKLGFMFEHNSGRYARELSIWTNETNYVYYPLSYSLRDCLELICEQLGWRYTQYEIFESHSGCLHAMKPTPKMIEFTGTYTINGISTIHWNTVV